MTTVFLGQLYNVSIFTPEKLFIVVFGSALAAIAAAGPGVGAFMMISIVLNPLGIPVETALVLLIAASPIIDPIITLSQVAGNCAATVMIGERQVSTESEKTKAKTKPFRLAVLFRGFR